MVLDCEKGSGGCTVVMSCQPHHIVRIGLPPVVVFGGHHMQHIAPLEGDAQLSTRHILVVLRVKVKQSAEMQLKHTKFASTAQNVSLHPTSPKPPNEK